MGESSPNEKKTLWAKEKLLVTSNFSFSRSVFKRLVLQTRKNQGSFGKGLSVLVYFADPKKSHAGEGRELKALNIIRGQGGKRCSL